MLAAALSPMLLSSCSSDFLDEVNPNQQTPATFWVNEENAIKGLSAAYNPFRRMMYGYYGAHEGIFHFQMRSDDMYPTRGEEAPIWQALSFTNTPNTKNNQWGNIYNGLALANEFLYQAPNVPMDKAKLDQMMGEAYFIRGFWFFRLRSDFNQGVIRTLPQVADSKQYGLSSPEEIMKQCIEDFTKAKELLPKDRPASENGRVTKGAAIAMLGKALLWNGEYAKAKAELDPLIHGYGYDLVADYSHNFRDDTEFNEESVFEIDYAQFGGGSKWGNSTGNNAFMGMNMDHFFAPGTGVKGVNGGWYKMQPSPYLIHQFIQEERPEGADSRWDKRLYTNCYFKYSDYNDVKEDELYFDGKVPFDSIYYQTVYKDNKWKLGAYSPTYPEIDGKMGRFIWKKWSTWWRPEGTSMYGTDLTRLTNLRVMRFAEVLFLHAEAAIETGDLNAAMDDINRIRVRAGLVEKHLSDKASLTEELRNQKMLEFAGENIRWYDLIRWYSFDELKSLLMTRKSDSSKYVEKGMIHFPQDEKERPVFVPEVGYPNSKLVDTQNYGDFEKKHLYFPIPQSEVDANQELEQKTEWQ